MGKGFVIRGAEYEREARCEGTRKCHGFWNKFLIQ